MLMSARRSLALNGVEMKSNAPVTSASRATTTQPLSNSEKPLSKVPVTRSVLKAKRGP